MFADWRWSVAPSQSEVCVNFMHPLTVQLRRLFHDVLQHTILNVFWREAAAAVSYLFLISFICNGHTNFICCDGVDTVT